MTSLYRVAKRYATALFRAAVKEGSLEDVKADLAFIDAFLREHPNVSEAMRAPRIPVERRTAVFHSLFESRLRENLTMRFLDLLVARKRETAIHDVVKAFTVLDEESRGIVTAHVRTALPLDEDQVARLKTSLDAMTGKNVRLDFAVEPGLIGGVTVHIGDTVLDGSVKGYLDQFAEQIRSVPARALMGSAAAEA